MINRKHNLIKLSFMIIVTVGAQILTLVKSTIVASTFGTSESMDAYNFANSIVSFLFGIVVSGISTIVIPEYANKNKKRPIDTFITVIFGGSLIATAMMILLRYPLIELLSNRGAAFTTIAANLLAVLLFSQYLATFTGVTTAYFQCENKHNIPKLINLLCQAGVIAVIAALNNKISILHYALIIAGGNVLCFLIETAFALKAGWRFKPALLFNQSSIANLKRFVPIVFSGGIYRLSLLIDTIIASSLTTGLITVLGYATQISTIASTVVVGNLLLFIYPQIAKEVKNSGYQERFWETTGGMHAVVCLMIAGFLCVGKEAVFILLNRGAFSVEACEKVFYAAAIYIAGQGFSIIRDMIYRYFYAIGDTKTPAQNSVLVSVCNIILSLVFVKLIGFYGIVLGTVLASIISLIMIVVRFHKKIGLQKKVGHTIKCFAKNVLILATTVIVVYATKWLLPIENRWVSVLVFGIQTVAIYVAIQVVINKNIIKALKNL